MKQYLYIENNQVVVNPEEMPELTETLDQIRNLFFRKALSEWQKNCKPVENICKISDESIFVSVENFKSRWVFPGHPCETTETEPYRVTKIL